MFLVGMLTAQEIINVLTKLGIIMNIRYSENVVVALGTKTSKRLCSLGINTRDKRNELMDYLSVKMNSMEGGSAENALCKARHNKYSNRKLYAMVGGNDSIYTYHERLF